MQTYIGKSYGASYGIVFPAPKSFSKFRKISDVLEPTELEIHVHPWNPNMEVMVWFRWFSDFHLGDLQVPAVNFQGCISWMIHCQRLWVVGTVSGWGRSDSRQPRLTTWNVGKNNYIAWTVLEEEKNYTNLGGSFKYFLFSPLFGEDSHFD